MNVPKSTQLNKQNILTNDILNEHIQLQTPVSVRSSLQQSVKAACSGPRDTAQPPGTINAPTLFSQHWSVLLWLGTPTMISVHWQVRVCAVAWGAVMRSASMSARALDIMVVCFIIVLEVFVETWLIDRWMGLTNLKFGFVNGSSSGAGCFLGLTRLVLRHIYTSRCSLSATPVRAFAPTLDSAKKLSQSD